MEEGAVVVAVVVALDAGEVYIIQSLVEHLCSVEIELYLIGNKWGIICANPE